MTRRHSAPGRVGFVSLGCPKALVDSERILTQLRAEGYPIAPRYEDADLVVVNTCGFIDAAVEESLAAIGEALSENGKVIVTGCLGGKDGGAFVRAAHPKVLAVTGPHAAPEVMAAVVLGGDSSESPFDRVAAPDHAFRPRLSRCRVNPSMISSRPNSNSSSSGTGM